MELSNDPWASLERKKSTLLNRLEVLVASGEGTSTLHLKECYYTQYTLWYCTYVIYT